MSTPRRRGALRVAGDVLRTLRAHDPLLYAAGVTFYAAIAIVPLALVTVWLLGIVIGHDQVRDLGNQVADNLPRRLGVQPALRGLVDQGSDIHLPYVLWALLPASFYGEGLRRAFTRLSPGADENPAQVAWRGRLQALAAFGFSPVLLLVVVGSLARVTDLRSHGLPGNIAALTAAFLVGWAVCGVAVAYAYRLVAPAKPDGAALWRGSLIAGGSIAGLLVAFVLYLNVPLAKDSGKAYGGLGAVGDVAISMGWFYALHVILIVGYVLLLRLDEAGGSFTRAADRRYTRGAGRPQSVAAG